MTVPEARLLARPLSAAEAREICTWRYPPPYDVYDLDDAAVEVLLREGPDGEGYRPAVDPDGALVAYACLGAEARVTGQEARASVLDVGLGVRPDLVSRGLGGALLPQVLALAGGLGLGSVRVAVAAFNDRSLALCRRVGLREVRRFPGPGGREFVELVSGTSVR